MEINDLVVASAYTYVKRDGYEEQVSRSDVGLVLEIVEPHAKVAYLPNRDNGDIRTEIIPCSCLRIVGQTTYELFTGVDLAIDHYCAEESE